MENVIAVLAALVVAALMIWPIWMGVYDPEERGRRAFTCAIATSVWTWWYLAHIDGMTWAATTLVIFALGLPASCFPSVPGSCRGATGQARSQPSTTSSA